MAAGTGGGNRRPYRSPLREERARRTRRAVLAAAHELFVAHGYAATTMRAVAAAAGVSVPTVEQLFGTKRGLLAHVVDVARAGDDEPVALLDRAPARAAEAAATAAEFLAAATAEIGAVAARASAVQAVLAAAAAGDAEIAGLAREIDAQRRAVASWLVDGVDRRAGLRVDRDRAVDAVWALLDPVVHRRLTADCGWTGEEFAGWLADALDRLLPPGP
ncbi:TetR family transcriptional regulator [Pseudonocardia lacus]|uniref:TetR family transcriptional regulator n=1 Tax=Pseudonocardia lacus TaxID=2835865 RepID=UPI001BDCCD78|nr:TetR family transcriptional regulator [Pseudonocardia lacus]